MEGIGGAGCAYELVACPAVVPPLVGSGLERGVREREGVIIYHHIRTHVIGIQREELP